MEIPAGQPVRSVSRELLNFFRSLEGRFSPAEVATRVVEAALALPGVGGARLWRVDHGTAQVWSAAGCLPPTGDNDTVAGVVINPVNDQALWAAVLGSDDYRVRVLEVRGDGPLNAAERTQLEIVGSFAGVVLALAERRGAMEELSSIVEATKRLNSTLDLGELIHIILQIATRQTGAERGTVFLLDSERGEIWSLVGLGLEQQVIRLPVGRGIAGWVALSGTGVRLEDAYKDERFEPEIDRTLGFTTRRLLCLPIRNEAGSVIGVLQLLNKPEPFTGEDQEFLDALSAHVALALEKAQLHRERLVKERLERDLALAREIQAGFLPDRPPAFPGIEIAVQHRPSQMVGGDYYDFLPVTVEGREALLLVVADVEGKGAASALVMANVQAILHTLADHVDPLEKLPEIINQKILEGARASMVAGRATKYLSVFLALVEQGGRKIRYVNAGHVPPLVVRRSGCEWLEAGGMIVGLLPETRYESGAIELEPGDVLVACTDGITEAMDRTGTEYGRPRLRDTVAGGCSGSAEEILRRTWSEVEEHARGGLYEDDRVLLVMKIQPRARAGAEHQT
jgi:phosphoserine phosphatase RsbU/P